MAKKIIFTLIVLLALFSFFVQAQIYRDTPAIRCGDGVLDAYEMCEKDIDTDRCEKMGELLEIDSDCREEVCVCLPFINSAFCGNDRREGVEMCDGIGEDFCPEFGEFIGVNLTCGENCYCEIVGGVPASYYPGYNETEDKPEGMAVCGDSKLQLEEECDPPNSLCTLEDGSVGICKSCKCVEKESIGIEKQVETEDEEEIVAEDEEEEIEEKEIEDEEKSLENNDAKKAGFFAGFWNWIKELFS